MLMAAPSAHIRNPMIPMKVRIPKKLSPSPVTGHNVPIATRRATSNPSHLAMTPLWSTITEAPSRNTAALHWRTVPIMTTSRAARAFTVSLDAAESMCSWARTAQNPFHRTFKAVTGVTPWAYASAHRAERVREALTKSASVTEAIYDAGFNSNGRFYAAAPGLLGMQPTKFRSGGKGEVIRFAVGECSLGSFLVAATDIGVCVILLGDEPDTLITDLQDRFPGAELIGGDEQFERLVFTVVAFIEKPRVDVRLLLDVRGTAFQQRVWKALRQIPSGTTVSYAELAKRIGAQKAVRAVAQACASNTIAVAIPCHRVVRSDGALSGYRWGVERKRALLKREGAS